MKYYMLILFSAMLFFSCAEKESNKNDKTTDKTVPARYPLAIVQKAGVSTTITLPAQLAAYQEVSIFPKVNGYVKQVLVDIGSVVKKGMLLMILEAPELQQASLQAKERYVRNRANFSIDAEQYQRYLEASATAGAISPLDLSTIRAKMEADSALANAEKLNWEMQQTMMGYLKVTAPFDGVITERNVHPGALVSAAAKDKPMLELKQVDHLRLQASVPENISGSLKTGDTVSFYLNAMPGKKMIGIINRQSGNMSAMYRSERVEIDVENKNKELSPGMYASVVLNAKGSANALTVPKSAVVTSTERKYVLLAEGNKITRVDVRTGNETAGKIEVFGALQPGAAVIANATDEISERK